MNTALLIEDEDLFAKSVARRLQRENISVAVAQSLEQAKVKLKQEIPDLILLDVRLPDGNGLDLLTEIRSKKNEALQRVPIIVMTAYGEIDDAVSAMKSGATDYLKKPVDLDELLLTLSKVMSTSQLKEKLNYSQTRDQYAAEKKVMIGSSETLQAIQQQIEKIAKLVEHASDHSPVILLRGETGTGKDVAAHLYHQTGSWNRQPFVHVDCASLPKDLLEAELFGYEQGAFTGANKAKAGLIEIAENGTLFLDEVGELPLDLQVKLLNVLERRVIRRIGSIKEISVKAHFVAATNRDLSKMVDKGDFRSDLYYRLNVLELELPPLRERQQDILLLADYFINHAARRYGLQPSKLSQDASSALYHYHWPGNIRELQHVIERAVMLCKDNIIHASDLLLTLPANTRSTSQAIRRGDDLETMTLAQVEKYLIEQALKRTRGNVSQAAKELGLTRMAMRYRMEKHQIT